MFPLWNSCNTHTVIHTGCAGKCLYCGCNLMKTAWECTRQDLQSLAHTHTYTVVTSKWQHFKFEMEKSFPRPLPGFRELASLRLPPFAPSAHVLFFHLLPFCYLVFAVFVSHRFLLFISTSLRLLFLSLSSSPLLVFTHPPIINTGIEFLLWRFLIVTHKPVLISLLISIMLNQNLHFPHSCIVTKQDCVDSQS